MQKQDISPHALPPGRVIELLESSYHGLSISEVNKRLETFGRNCLPSVKRPGLATVFLHQFYSPLIYVLLAAALISVFIQEWSDAGFIFAVLIINAVIGTIQEYYEKHDNFS